MGINISYDKQQEIILDCKKSMASWYSYFSINIERARDNAYFYAGNQWEDSVIKDYVLQNKVTLVIDLISAHVKKMMGEQKNADVSPTTIPATSDIDPEDMELVTGMLRHILYSSEASSQFAEAFEKQLSCGWGVLKIFTDYYNPNDFDQEIGIGTENEPINVFFDPLAMKSTKCDGRVCGDLTLMSKDDFEKTYPGAEFPGYDFLPEYAPKPTTYMVDTAAVVHFIRKEMKSRTLIELTDGKDYVVTGFLKDKEQMSMEYFAAMEAKGVPLLEVMPLQETNRRKTQITRIMRYTLTQYEVLDAKEWPCEYLPYLFVDGDSTVIDGQQYTRALIEYAKDAQRLYNYAISEIANALKVSRREKFFMTPAQIAGFERMYTTPEQVKGALLFNPDDRNPGAPSPIPSPEVNQSFFEAAQNAAADITRTLGMMDPLTSGIPTRASGIAMGRTIAQQNLTTVNFLQNLYNAEQELGRIILSLIPKVYDNQRMVTIVDGNRKPKRVKINGVDEYGNPKNDIASIIEGVHDVEINVGCSFEQQRQQSLEFLMQMMQVRPDAFNYIGDLIPQELALPIAPKLAERFKMMIPPAIIAQENGEPPPPPPPPAPEVMLQQQELQLKSKEIEIKQQELGLKQQDMQLSHQYEQMKAQVEQFKMQQSAYEQQIELIKAQIEAGSEIQTAKIDAHAQIIKSITDLQKAEHQRETVKLKMNSSSPT